MTQDSVTRRDFMRLGAGAAAHGAFPGALGRSAAMPASTVFAASTSTAHGTAAEMAMAQDWAQSYQAASPGAAVHANTQLLPERLLPPFSFVYGGRKSAELLPSWSREVKVLPSEAATDQFEVLCSDPATGLQLSVVITRYKDFPAVESILYFRNTGASDTPILEDIQALDAVLRVSETEPILHYAKGATCSMDDFMPMTLVLGNGAELDLNAGGGRSSSQFLPFFNIESNGEGMVLGIGWTGEWAARFHRPDKEPRCDVRAGMALTHFKLHPGEEIRSPRMLTLFWKGEPQRGQNLLRQFVLAHHRPAPGGRPFVGPLTTPNWGGTPAKDHLENIRQIIAHDLPMEYYWIDAEWFGSGQWWQSVGNWEVKRDLYPQGFKPISDLLHSSGRKLLLWFEPERVCAGTPWYTEHSEWLLELPADGKHYRGFSPQHGGDLPQTDPRWVPAESDRNQMQDGDKLFNLAIPEARQFLTDFISAKVDEFGLDCFRNDANIAPLEFWRAADTPDRQGITEIRWVEGLYLFWDELRRRHPKLLIDDCASGGRRIDLETIGRSTVVSRTDFVGNLLANQCHSYGLFQWVPYGLTTTGSLSRENNYRIRSSMSGGLSYALFTAGDTPQPQADYQAFPFTEIKKSIEQYVEIQKYYYGDFYPLTEYSQGNDVWMAYQLDLRGGEEGLLVVLKRPLSDYTHAAFALRALEEKGMYEIANLDSGERKSWTGNELMQGGVEVLLPAKPDSALFTYRRTR